MFRTWREARKIINKQNKGKAFELGNIECTKYDDSDNKISLKSGKYKAEVAFAFVHCDGEIKLAFSGDEICKNGKILTNIMKTMWNRKLPELPESEALRKQLLEQSLQNEGADAQPNSEEPIYFRDMADHVAGEPNNVFVVTRAYYSIENE